DEAGSSNGRTAVFAFEAFFPIDVAVAGAVTRGGAIHVDDGDEVTHNDGRRRIAGTAAGSVPNHLGFGHIAVTAGPHGIDFAALETVNDAQAVARGRHRWLTTADGT